MDEEKIETIKNKYGTPSHYHGDVLRKLFILAAIVMISTLPFLSHLIPVSYLYSIVGIIVLVSTAGFIKPRNKFAIIVDFIISIIGVFVFEYYAMDAYIKYSASSFYFVTNQTLGLIFLFALYYASKTVRAAFAKN